MSEDSTSDCCRLTRGRFLGTAAVSIAAAQFGMFGPADAPSSTVKRADRPTIKPGTNTSFGPLKQIESLWPERCKALVSVTGTNLTAVTLPRPPKSEWDWWYQYYFTTERGVLGLTDYRYDLGKFAWTFTSPTWKFSEATYNLTAAAFKNPDYVRIVIGNCR